MQKKLWPDWPNDAPTNIWLHPDDKSVSQQQKRYWYQCIETLVKINISQAIKTQNPNEIQLTINDAIKALRNKIWNTPEARRVEIHNIDYGFARNLTGLRSIWISFSIMSTAICWYTYTQNDKVLLLAIASTLILIIAFVLAIFLPAYVRQKAHYYAESFFGTIVKLTEANENNQA